MLPPSCFGRHALSDPGNQLARQFGILYTFDEASQQSSIASGKTIGEVTGTGTWELPQPTAIVIGQNGVVRFADVHPDWLLRTEAEPILAALAAIPAPKQKSTAVSLGA